MPHLQAAASESLQNRALPPPSSSVALSRQNADLATLYQCDNCVDGIDHHCAYLHTCVGRNNYTSFLACLFFTVLSLVYMIVWSAVFLWRAMASQGRTFGRALGDEAGSGVVFVLEVLMLMPVGSLMSYHFWVRLLSLSLLSHQAITDLSDTCERS